jgi:hypothetical protein
MYLGELERRLHAGHALPYVFLQICDINGMPHWSGHPQLNTTNAGRVFALDSTDLNRSYTVCRLWTTLLLAGAPKKGPRKWPVSFTDLLSNLLMSWENGSDLGIFSKRLFELKVLDQKLQLPHSLVHVQRALVY